MFDYYYHIGYSHRGSTEPSRYLMTQTQDSSEATLPAPEDVLPLTPATFHVLLALVGQERHGYSIMREVESYTRGAIRLGATTLYRTIKQMLAARLIEEAEERPDPELDDERRRYYRITPFGQRVLQAETRRLAALVALAHEKGVLAADDRRGAGGLGGVALAGGGAL